MKDKILWAIAGFLLGALAASAGFYFYADSVKMSEMQMQEPPAKPDEGTGKADSGMEPPAKPEDAQ